MFLELPHFMDYLLIGVSSIEGEPMSLHQLKEMILESGDKLVEEIVIVSFVFTGGEAAVDRH